jgi:hypothetical protein
MSEPPPPRYRIVERGRRLVVIDTWNKGVPSSDAGPMPSTGVGSKATSRPAMATRPGFAGPRGASGLNGLLVQIACFGSDDGAGHPILTTHEYYDAKGPRDITLSAAGERRLGRMLFNIAFALVFTVALMWFLLPLLVLLVFGAIAINASMKSFARPTITLWLDGLEAQSTA